MEEIFLHKYLIYKGLVTEYRPGFLQPIAYINFLSNAHASVHSGAGPKKYKLRHSNENKEFTPLKLERQKVCR
jgi:hypothetical protein